MIRKLGGKSPKFREFKSAKNGVGVTMRVLSKDVTSPKNWGSNHPKYRKFKSAKTGWRSHPATNQNFKSPKTVGQITESSQKN